MRNPYLHILMIGLVIGADFLFFAAMAPVAEAYPARYYRRGPAERSVDRQVARRTARRTSRRVTRRHLYGLPAGYRSYYWGGHSYYLAGGVYYYPYFYGGRTVYVEIEVDSSGRPYPPPAASEIDFNVSVY